MGQPAPAESDAGGRRLVRQEEDHPLPAAEDLLPEEGVMEPLEVDHSGGKGSEKDVGDLQEWTKLVQEATNFRINCVCGAGGG